MSNPPSSHVRVCWTHGRVNVCDRMSFVGPSCEWREDRGSVTSVMDYQLRKRLDWKS